MANRNKVKGTQWESDVRDYLNRTLILVGADGKFLDPFNAMNVRRPAQEGAQDVGDIHAVPFILEAKNVKNPAVPTWIRQAQKEARHAGFPYGVVVHKARGLGVRSGRVHFDVRTWTRTRTALGLSSRAMADRYGFAASLRGLDSGRWYLTTSVERFARLLADVRAVREVSRAVR